MAGGGDDSKNVFAKLERRKRAEDQLIEPLDVPYKPLSPKQIQDILRLPELGSNYGSGKVDRLIWFLLDTGSPHTYWNSESNNNNFYYLIAVKALDKFDCYLLTKG